MHYSNIIDSVEKSIGTLCREFQSRPNLFFTENDIVCFFYNILRQNLSNPFAKDKDGYEHLLIHGEYPTPFRCDMRGDRFEIKDDNETKYKRGHYDIVVLNHDFIKAYSYSIIKGQNYEEYKRKALSDISNYSPIVLYGIEFMYSRDPLKFSKGEDKERGVEGFVAKVLQDAKKLAETKKWNEGFMGHSKMLTFVKGSSPEMQEVIKRELSKVEGNILTFGEGQQFHVKLS
jgi:hypothetical protein